MSAEDRKRFEQVDGRIDDLYNRVTSLQTDMTRHEEQTRANFADVRRDIKDVTEKMSSLKKWVIAAIVISLPSFINEGKDLVLYLMSL